MNSSRAWIFFLPLALSLAPFTASASGFFVGNGGEGVKWGEQILLRDLVEAGIYEVPALPAETVPLRLAGAMDGFFGREVAALVEAELGRIESQLPGFGWALARVILGHRWFLVSTPVTPDVPPPGDVVDIPRENIVPVANRYKNVIRIFQPHWERMPLAHRVALVMHEAMFSLATPRCGKRYCTLLDLDVRNLTAGLYQARAGEGLDSLLERTNVFSLTQPPLIDVVTDHAFGRAPLSMAADIISSACRNNNSTWKLSVIDAPLIRRIDYRTKNYLQQTSFVALKDESAYVGPAGGCVANAHEALRNLLTRDLAPKLSARPGFVHALLAAFPERASAIASEMTRLSLSRGPFAGCRALALQVLETKRSYLDSRSAATKVEILFRALLGRSPDREGGRFYEDKIRKGEPFLTVAAELANSREFADRCASFRLAL